MLKKILFLGFVVIALLSCEKDWDNPFDPNSDKFQEFIIDNSTLDFGVATRYDTTSRETKIYNNISKLILITMESSNPYFKSDSMLILGGLYHGDLSDSLYIATAFNSSGIPTTYFPVNNIYNKNLSVAFTPTEIKNYSGTITVKASTCSYAINTQLSYTYITLTDIKSIGKKTITVSGTGSTVAATVDLVSVANTNLGYAPMNKQKSQKICITNTTAYPLTITGISYPACFSGQDTLSLSANGSDSINITLSPTEKDKDYTGMVTLTFSGGMQDTFRVMATSQFDGSIFAYDSIDLGYVPLNRSKTQNLVIKNNTSFSINITNISYPSCFSGADSVSVPADSSVYLPITFVPTATNTDYEGKLLLTTDIGFLDTITLKGTSKYNGNIFTYDSTDIGVVSKTQNVVIKNSLAYLINITSIIYPSKFSGASSLSVPASGSVKLKLTFTPTETKDYRDTIKLVTDIGTTENLVVYGYVEDGEIEFVLVEAGTFQMGNDSAEFKYNKPAHTVTLTKNYYIGKFEITNEEVVKVFNQAKKVVSGLSFSSTSVSYKGNELIDLDKKYAEGGDKVLCEIGFSNDTLYVKNGKNRYPAGEFSWYGATAFVEFMNILSGTNKYRLPTEAEWEFAARGGNKSKGYLYSGSNTIDDVAWYSLNSSNEFHKIGSKAPNELGLYDMSGNVNEWCSDWLEYYSSESQTDPSGPSIGTYRVRRNGNAFATEWLSRVYHRYPKEPNYTACWNGFRIVMDVE